MQNEGRGGVGVESRLQPDLPEEAVVCVWGTFGGRLSALQTAAAAARRRAEAFGREERGRRERAAHWMLHTRGYSTGFSREDSFSKVEAC